MQDYFFTLAEQLGTLLRGGEVFTCWFSAEQSDFVRFNRARVRQAGAVLQQTLHIDLIDGRRHAAASLGLRGDPAADRARLAERVEALRRLLPLLPEDPHLLYASDDTDPALPVSPWSSGEGANCVFDAGAISADILAAAEGLDLVGILAAGTLQHGFANSLGRRGWHASHSFNFDWSVYLRADRAIKSRYAGFDWRGDELRRRLTQVEAQLSLLGRQPRTLTPGDYRVLLTPAALEEVMNLLSWDAFSLRAQRTGRSPLRRLVDGETRLHPGFTLIEDTAGGIAPGFQSAGFTRPARLALVEDGLHRAALAGPRSAAEYGVPCNGAGADESPQSLALTPGALGQDDALQLLDTGLYVGNLWYLNYSDRNSGRITGMTRFGTFWVEHGEPRCPVEHLRFDDTLYRLFGEQLLGLGSETELLLDPGSYGGRSSRCQRLPAALIGQMRFTL